MTPSAWLDTILATPDDDAPRRVYADWLSENGDADRAQLVRDQCDLSGLWPWDAETQVLHRRVRRTLARHGRRWMAELPTLDGVTWGAFERGFVSHVHVADLGTLDTHAEAIRRVAPIRGVTLAAAGYDTPTTSDLSWIREIHFSEQEMITTDDLAALLATPLGQGLEVLDLSGQGLENRGVTTLLRSLPPRLTALDLSNNYVGNAGFEALCSVEALTGLQYLSLASFGSGYVDDPFVDQLAPLSDPACSLTGLATLHLAGRPVPQSQLEAVISAPHLASLHTLGIAGYGAPRGIVSTPRHDAPGLLALRLESWLVDDIDLGRLLALPQVGRLARLALHNVAPILEDFRQLEALSGSLQDLRLNTKLPEGGAAALAKANWPRLHTLHLNGTDLAPTEMAKIARGSFPALSILSLGTNPQLGDDAAAAIAGATWAPSLRRLNLFRCGIGPEGAHALATSTRLADLEALTLRTNPLGVEGATAVVNGRWRRLTDLHLSSTEAGDATVAALAATPHTDTLLDLDLSDCRLTGSALALLASAELDTLFSLNLSRNHTIGDGDQWQGTLSAAHFPALTMLTANTLRVDPLVLMDPLLLGQLHSLASHGNETSEAFYATQRTINDKLPCPWTLSIDAESD